MKEIKKIVSLGKNYKPGTQSFAAGFLGPRGDVGFHMVFDYPKAKRIMKNLKNGKITSIIAGLDGDFSFNSQEIYDGKKWIENSDIDFYKHSIWAMPIILIEFSDKPQEGFECYKKGDVSN